MTDSKNILVTGGAGYIGSHVVLSMLDDGEFSPVVLDNLSTGARRLVPPEVPFIDADISDAEAVGRAIDAHQCEAVMHFAGSIIVPESVADPLKYYDNNVVASVRLIRTCVDHGVTSMLFSSTASVYGEPDAVPVDETGALRPANPYGRSKLMIEDVLNDVAAASDMRFAALRYFNVAGADRKGRSGQLSPQSTHLIKIACEAATGKRDRIEIYWTDYDTPDGSCVRDFIHVSDLADAHILTVRHLIDSRQNLVLNCGYGRGFSVREVVDQIQRFSDGPIRVDTGPRRPGDVAELVADSRKLRALLAWEPRHDDIATIIESALDWEKSLA